LTPQNQEEETMALVTQLSVFIPNRIGSLSELCTTLSDAHINIRAISTLADVAYGIVGLIVDDLDKAKSLLREMNLKYGESTVLVVELQNKPGDLARITRRLSEEKINILHTYATAASERSLLVLLTTDNKKAEEILH